MAKLTEEKIFSMTEKSCMKKVWRKQRFMMLRETWA
ncbi:Uncharacterised protein [Listeria grayi]|uniref:Uncharacterized protein n=1 Tax=Listeria grayi TaxID=1641 RepID=A0A378ME07_LISGR|nr:Uncharacterised protein [Listeria grayi]